MSKFTNYKSLQERKFATFIDIALLDVNFFLSDNELLLKNG